MKSKFILGLIGEPASGKIAIAKHLIERHAFARVRMMEPVHRMLEVGFGLGDEDFEGEAKTRPLPQYGGLTPTALKTMLGYDWGRRTVHSDVWATQYARIVNELAAEFIVTDDIRFPNEIMKAREQGAVIVRVDRPSVQEGRAQKDLPYDFVITNDKTLDDLFSAADDLVARLMDLRKAA
jgi:dephospho-CoA kinase